MKKNLKPKLIASSRGCMCFPSEPAHTFYLFRVARGSRRRHPASILCLPGGPMPDGLDLEACCHGGAQWQRRLQWRINRRFAGTGLRPDAPAVF